MRAGNEKRPFGRNWFRLYPEFRRPRVRHGYCAFDVKFARASVIEQPKRGVAALLEFGDDEPRADCVYLSGRHVNEIAWRQGRPLDEIRDRAVINRRR